MGRWNNSFFLSPYPHPPGLVPYPSPTVLSHCPLSLPHCPIPSSTVLSYPLSSSRPSPALHPKLLAPIFLKALRAPGGEFHPRMGGAQTARFRMYISEGALRCARSDRERNLRRHSSSDRSMMDFSKRALRAIGRRRRGHRAERGTERTRAGHGGPVGCRSGDVTARPGRRGTSDDRTVRSHRQTPRMQLSKRALRPEVAS